MMLDRNRRDDGAILPLVLVVSLVLSIVVVSLATYVTTDLRYAQVTQARAERQAASTSAITYGVERIRLRKTLCSTGASDFGPVDQAIVGRNGTTTALTCSRFAGGLSDISGWAMVITGNGITSNLLEVKGGGIKEVTGPVFIRDVNQISFSGAGPELDHLDGDLWHRRSTCPGAPVTFSGTYKFIPANAHGPLCTTTTWNNVVTAPVVPALGSLPVRTGSFTLNGTCRVFEPGRYTSAPNIGLEPSYFRSGSYYFDNVGMITVRQQSIWFGYPGALRNAEDVGNAACTAARDADPNISGPGAVAYFGGNSALEVETQGKMEFFPKLVNGKLLSVQEVEASSGFTASTVTAASGNPLIYIGNGSNKDLVFHGLVYTPNAWFAFDNSSNTAKQKLLGGAVVGRMSIQASASASGFEISVATTPFESNILLRATSTSADGASTTAEAVVEYRADETDPNKRVAVNSLRVLD